MCPPCTLGQEGTSRDPWSHCGRAVRGQVWDFGGEVEPEDAWTRETGGACGGPQGAISSGGLRGPGILGCSPHLPGSAFCCRRGPGAMSEGSAATAAPGAAPSVCPGLSLQDCRLHPNPASPALPGAPSPRSPPCHTPPPGRTRRCPLSPAVLHLRLSRCPSSPRLPSGTPNIRAAPAGEPRAVPTRSPQSPWSCHSKRLSQPRENLPRLSFSRLSAAPGEVPGQEVQGGIGQGREQRVCTGTWGSLSRDPAPPGPCPTRARDHRPAVAQLPWGRSPGHRQPNAGGGGTVGSGVSGSGGDGSSGRWELLGTCLNKVLPGRVNVRAGAGPKADAGLWQPWLS